jgi:glucosylceramidase
MPTRRAVRVAALLAVATALPGLTSACGTPSDPSGDDNSGGTGAASGGGSAGTSNAGTGNSPAGGSGASAGSGLGGSAGSTGAVGGTTGGTTGGDGVGGAAGSGTSGSAGNAGIGGGGSGGAPPVDRPGLVTSGPGAYWQTGTLTPASGQATVTVNAATTHQNWIGFGGTFNEAGWDALAELSAADRDRAIRLLFGAADGANFAWGRIPIGASDYAIDRYTLNETAGDYAMASFSIERDRQRLIPYVKAAQSVKTDIRFWGSPWTPPTWMKNPARFDGTDASPSGTPAATYTAFMKNDAQTLTAYALYFARWVEEYEREGIPIDSVHPQNEPGYATRYPSCRWDAGLLGTFVGQYLAPAFATRNLDTQIWFGTLSNNESAIYNGNIGGLTGAAEEACVGVGLQWNTMPHTSELAARGFLVMQTEHRCGNYPFNVPGTPAFNPDRPANDHAYAVESWGYIRDWLKAGVNAYSAWNMVLDTVGKNLDAQRPWPQNALLVVDRATNRLIETPTYYLFRHLSYFVDPGATRVEATGGDALAFRNPDGSLIAIVFNSGNQNATIAVAMGGSTFQVQVPGQGWATLNFEG